MEIVLEVSDIGKEVAGRKLFQHVSFSCTRDTILFVQGGNGSGKSTLLKILAGIYKPTDGEVRLNTKKIGYVPEHFPEGLRFKVKEYLSLTASFYPSMKENEMLLVKYMDIFGLGSFQNTPLANCSKGTKQKVGIIQALLMRPDLLLLDEPLTGLDQESQQAFVSLLQEFRGQIPIIFTAHEDGPITQVATETLHIETGKMTVYQPQRKQQRLIRVKFRVEQDLAFVPSDRIQFDRKTAVITVEEDKSDNLLRKLLGVNCSILEVKVKS
ncbi:ABC-type multidrug transport system ATPase subunit [Sporosarcina luteola]|nr:ABC-type multidrug transport system ATPase subunit [Sporosarcina luteola]